MRLTDDIDGLINTIGKNRSSSPPEEVAEAEEKLRQAVADSRLRTVNTAKSVGTLVAVFGLVIAVFPVILVTAEREIFYEWDSEAEGGTFAERAFLIFLPLMMVFQIVLGLTLAAGGIGFRMLKNWGRRAILAVIWIYITYCICAFIYFEATALLLSGDNEMSLLMALGCLFVTVFWVLLLWLAQRYFRSERIRSLCR